MSAATIHTGYKTLNTGASIPSIGLGTWKAPDDECYNSVLTALRNGYRHIDTAKIYNNEVAVGKGINDFLKESGIPREELFITTKLWGTDCKDPLNALKESLLKLNLDYVDLYLIHWPVAIPNDKGDLMPSNEFGHRLVLPFNEWNYLNTFREMQKLPETGLTKAIGISNFNKSKIEKILNDNECKIKPACNQIELHPYLAQSDLINYCNKNNIIVECYSPLGSTGAPVLNDELLLKLSKKYNVSPACISISWAVGRDTIPLPKSVNPKRIEDNLKIVDLSDDDIKLITENANEKLTRIVNPDWTVDINIFEESDVY